MIAPDATHARQVFHVLVGRIASVGDRCDFSPRIAGLPTASAIGIWVGEALAILIFEYREHLEGYAIRE